MKKQNRKQIKGDVNLIHKSEKQALEARADESMLYAVRGMATTEHATARLQAKPVVRTPLVE